MRRAQAVLRCRLEIVAVRGRHHAFARLDVERLGGGEIDARLRLEVAGNLGAEDRIPSDVVAPRNVDHDRDIAVRAGRHHEALTQAGETGANIRPGIEAMPGEIELVEHLRVGLLKSELRQNALEHAPMDDVELDEGSLAGAHLIRARLILWGPGV